LRDTKLSISKLELDGEERLRAEIETSLISGKWVGGTRLPTERVLSKEFNIARSRVRRVLQLFEIDGRISRTVGKGTFVVEQSSLGSIKNEDIEKISPEDLIEARLIVEPNTAELLVRRASAVDIGALQNILDKAKQARSMAEFEEYDHMFHMALAQAAKNAYLVAMIARMQAVRQSRSWVAIRRRGLTANRQAFYQSQHEAILAALQARDSNGLRRVMREHLLSVRQNLEL
jgi:DNA-binding FadR family transcriptional regulator